MSDNGNVLDLLIIYPTEYFYPNELTPYPSNYNLHPESQIEELRESLETFGQFKPVVVWRCPKSETLPDGNELHEGLNYLICGHGLWQASLRTSIEKLEAKNITGVSRELAEAILVADNAAPLGSEPDAQRLAALLERARVPMIDRPELGAMLERLRVRAGINGNGHEAKDAGPQIDKAAELQKVWGVKVGDVWELGQHRLVCGDCTDRAVVEAVMGRERADAVVTDPPYGMGLDTDFSGMGKVNEFVISKGLNPSKKYNQVIGDDGDFDPSFIFEQFPTCQDIFLFGADYYAERIPDRNNGSWFVWDKRSNNDGTDLDKRYGSVFELIWSRKKYRREMIRVKWTGFFGTETQDIRERIHPTQKPTGVVDYLLQKCNQEIIMDFYLGSGTTLIACEQLGRRCRGIEIEPSYCAVSLQRFVDAGGQTPRRVSG